MSTRRIYFETERTVTTKQKGWVEVDINYTQMYHSVFKYCKNLKNKYCVHYLLWIVSQANKTNIVPHGKEVIEKFRSEFSSKPSAGTVRNAISELTKNNVLIKYGMGHYQVNPIIFWGDDVSKRLEYIKSMEIDDVDYKLVE